MRIITILYSILNWIGAFTLYILVNQVAHKIIETLELKYDWMKYILYFGTGVILYYPVKYLLSKNIKENNASK